MKRITNNIFILRMVDYYDSHGTANELKLAH